jgi:uncharacterized RDD family membrane protein YckC
MTSHGTSPLPQEAEAFQGQAAGLVTRSLAAVVDVAVVAAAMLGAYVAVVAVRFTWNPRTFEFPVPSSLLIATVAIAIATCYLAAGWWIAGRSYGGALMGLRVVSRDGGRLRFLPALVRGAVCALFPLVLGWCAFGDDRRGLHDLLVRSRVIYDWRNLSWRTEIPQAQDVRTQAP